MKLFTRKSARIRRIPRTFESCFVIAATLLLNLCNLGTLTQYFRTNSYLDFPLPPYIPLACIILIGCSIWLIIDVWQKYASLDYPILADHGRNLTEVIQNLRGERYEYIALFDETGNKLIERTLLCRSSTSLSDADAVRYDPQYQQLVELHNHPDDDIPFSINDITLIIRHKPLLSIVVAKENLYILIPRAETAQYSDELKHDVSSLYERTYLANYFQWALRRKSRRHSINNPAVIACQKVAEEYGLEFQIIPFT